MFPALTDVQRARPGWTVVQAAGCSAVVVALRSTEAGDSAWLQALVNTVLHPSGTGLSQGLARQS